MELQYATRTELTTRVIVHACSLEDEGPPADEVSRHVPAEARSGAASGSLEAVEPANRTSEEQLVSAARNGDQQAFLELWGRCTDAIRWQIFRILRNHHDTDDIMQETLLKAYRHVGQFQGSSKFSTWVTRIAVNSALMLLRSRKARAEVYCESPDNQPDKNAWELADPSPNPEEIYTAKELRDRMSRSLKNLPIVFRNVVNEFYCQERSLKQISESSGVSVPAIKSRLRRARMFLRASMTNQDWRVLDHRPSGHSDVCKRGAANVRPKIRRAVVGGPSIR